MEIGHAHQEQWCYCKENHNWSEQIFQSQDNIVHTAKYYVIFIFLPVFTAINLPEE